MGESWAFWIDVGGTFTDCVARAPDGTLRQRKLLSTDDAPVLAIRDFLGLGDDEPIGRVALSLGTTRATNALLERNGEPVGLVATRGFADLPIIGTQARPQLFRLDVRKRATLHEHVVEVDERLDADGNVVRPLDDADAERALRELRDVGLDAVAICLLHAHANDAHERRVAEAARRMGFGHVSTSSSLTPTIGALDRCDTAVADA